MPTQNPDDRDTLVFRLARILVKLNQGERLDPQALAEEFGVTPRTIQRDLNERFAYLPLLRTEGRYHLDPAVLGRLGARDIERFAGLAGVRGLFPCLSDDFLRDIFDARIQPALLVRGHHYEDLSGREPQFRQLERAIVARRTLAFEYRREGRGAGNGDSPKTYAGVQPYRLINHKGIWYLAARDGDSLKTFCFSGIERLRTEDASFAPDPAIERRLAEDEGLWLGEPLQEAVILVAAEVAGYFRRRALIANQVIEKTLEDGGLILSARIGHPTQLLPIVRYWMPHLRILSPERLQQELEAELRAYLNR